MAANQGKTLRPKKLGRPRKEPDRREDASNEGRTLRRRESRLREKAAAIQSGRVVAPPDHPREEQPHGGALLRSGVPGNRGGYIAAMRRNIRKRLLRALHKGGGVEFLEQVIRGEVKRTIVTKDGDVREIEDQKFRKEAVETALRFGLGEISQHAIVNENDEQVEAGVVELPMMDAPPVLPPDATAAAEVARQTVRKAALDAAQALIQAAK